MKKAKPSLTSFQLKCIAALLMVLDSPAAVFRCFPSGSGIQADCLHSSSFSNSRGIFPYPEIGEGMLLGFWVECIIMAVGLRILTYLFLSDMALYNIFFSLGLGVALMSAWQQLRRLKMKGRSASSFLFPFSSPRFLQKSTYMELVVLSFTAFGKKEPLASHYILCSLLSQPAEPL